MSDDQHDHDQTATSVEATTSVAGPPPADTAPNSAGVVSDTAPGSDGVPGDGVGLAATEAVESLPAGEEPKSPRRRPWPVRAAGASRWVLAIPAVFLALYAEQVIRQALARPDRPPVPPLLGWQLYAAAGLLLALTSGAARLAPAAASQFLRSLRSLSMRRRLLFLILLAASIVCAGASVPLFTTLNMATDAEVERAVRNWGVNTGSWFLYLASLALFAAAFVVWERSAPSGSAEYRVPSTESPKPDSVLGTRYSVLSRGIEWALMASLFAVALFLRLRDLETVPPGLWFDEGQNGVVGGQLLAPDGLHRTFIPDATQMGALYFYFVGIVLKLFGETIEAVRFLPALGGALTVPIIYLLGARLYGWHAGLAAAGLLAVSAWNITFSRFGMASMPTVAVVAAVYLCAVQALRTGRLGYYAASGVLLGLGVHMYYIGRLVPFVLLAVLLHLLVTERMRLIRSVRAGIVVLALGVLLAALPVGLFALQRPDVYSGRTNDVSIFNPGNNGGDITNAIMVNLKTHMLMFDWQGDQNGRHNLAHTPMLDWLTAALFFGGLVSCAFRAWRWQYFFPIVWFAAALAGGVFTLPGEAPQSHRTLENSVVTALFAGVFLGQAWQVVARGLSSIAYFVLRIIRRDTQYEIRNTQYATRSSPVVAALSILGILVVVGLAGEMNYTKYFAVQAWDVVTWKEMGAASSFAAQVTARFGRDHDVYVVPVYKDFPPSKFLAPDIETRTWPGTDAIPLTSTRSSGAVIILDPSSAADISAFARVYPHARFEIQTPNSSEPIAYAVIVPASDLQTAHGVLAGVDGSDPNSPGPGNILPEFSYDWAKSGTSSGRLHLTSTLRVDTYGRYAFEWKNGGGSSAPADLLVDGYSIAAKQPVTLSRGLHTLALSADTRGQTGVSRLFWSSLGQPGQPGQPEGKSPTGEVTSVPVPASNLFDPRVVTPHGLAAAFRPGQGFDGPPTLERIDSVVSFYFQETPLPRPYTGEWRGRIYIPQDGDYRFGTQQVSTSQLSIDGQTVLSNDAHDSYQEQNLPLKAGWHDIRLRYSDHDNYSNVFLYWTPPGREKSIIPSSFLWPLMAQYPDKLEGRDAPTLEQSDGSSLPPDRITWFPPKSP